LNKIIISSILVVVLFANTMAQNFDIRGYAGWNISQYINSHSEKLIDDIVYYTTLSGRPGYQLGASILYGDRFLIQSGLEYSMLSTKITNKNIDNEYIDEIKLNVISIPIKLNIKIFNPKYDNNFNIRVFGGLYNKLSINTNHHKKSGISNDYLNKFTNFMLNADVGMGLDIFFLFIDTGYQIGLTPAYNDGSSTTGNMFYTNFGIKFNI
jgi:hypothetical protein